MTGAPTADDSNTPPAAGSQEAGACRSRRRAQPLSPGGQRPADLLTAFVVSGVAFLIAGGLVAAFNAAGLLDWWGRWLALHLLALGGVSQLVLGAAQFFSTAFLATDPPTRMLVRAELGVWAAGTVLVAFAVPLGEPALSDAGAALIVFGLGIFWYALRGVERRSLQTARWAVRWYYACAAMLTVGALAGMLMARGTAWSHGSLLGAHLALNLAGWLGTAIVGTLHTFFPSLTQSRLVYERLQGPTFFSWTGGVVGLAVGSAFSVDALTAAGWLALAAAATMLCVNLVASWRWNELPPGAPPGSAPGFLTGKALAARLVAAGQTFLIAGLGTALAMQIVEGPGAAPAGAWRAALAVLLMGGWIGMTVTGSLLHLLTVLNRVRRLGAAMPKPKPGRDTAQAVLPALAIAAVAISYVPGLDGLHSPAAVAALIFAAPVVGRILLLAARAAAMRLNAMREARRAVEA
ncbi:MAG: hypothetical protein HY827_07925 [Actinobacteria bacterium]|nr:hypothetical protein [Actinomycetota bacterium]